MSRQRQPVKKTENEQAKCLSDIRVHGENGEWTDLINVIKIFSLTNAFFKVYYSSHAHAESNVNGPSLMLHTRLFSDGICQICFSVCPRIITARKIKKIYIYSSKKFCTTYTILFVFTTAGCTASYFVRIIWCSCWFVTPPLSFEIYIALFLVVEGWLLLDIGWFVLFSNFWESITLPNVKQNVWNNTENIYGYVETNTQIFAFTWRLVWKFPKFTFFPKFWKMLQKLIMFIDKTL